MLIHESLETFIEETASKSPAPGGGSVAALAGSLGGALIAMVGNLTVGKKAFEALGESEKVTLQESMEDIKCLIKVLNTLVDEDTKAFDGVMAAYKMSKDTEEAKAQRREAIQRETKVALEVPLKTAQQCLEVLKRQKIFAQYGNKNAITDVGVGALMAYAGLEGALLNVKINLGSIRDEGYVSEIKAITEDVLKQGKALKEEVTGLVYDNLG